MISVAMTTYNGEKYICEQIESILNQSMKVDEIIVCDDGSSDSTIELLKKYPVKVVQNDVNLGYASQPALHHARRERHFPFR